MLHSFEFKELDCETQNECTYMRVNFSFNDCEEYDVTGTKVTHVGA